MAALLSLTLLACNGEPKPQAGENLAKSVAANASADPRAAIFLSKGCPQCHSVSALGVKSQAEVGPDLTVAYEDVRNRFGVELEQFLHNPTGTMQVVLSSSIQLSPAERDSIVRILKALHEEREERDERDEHSTKPRS